MCLYVNMRLIFSCLWYFHVCVIVFPFFLCFALIRDFQLYKKMCSS